MHLKKLVISGFKSFADRVILNFDRGITGIVGPNGSGKSNVIDAVRWVMGEQNAKHLRGQVATDIIFSGSEKRKQLGMAEVTLIFDNAEPDDFSPPEYRHDTEISITRRLYIDGQREYFINKKTCRLKDIVNFFAVTGLGGRSYSMIQQGQVDRILNARPEDVREILEEAAGTLVFKNRKNEAQKKLDSTLDNLSRVDDILEELNSQLGGLKGQVEKAREWKTLQGDLREKEISLFCHNFKHFSDRLLTLSSTMDNEETEEVTHIKTLTDYEVIHQKLQEKLATADPGLETLREELAQIREAIVRCEGVISNADVSIESQAERFKSLDEDQKQELIELESITKKIEDVEEKIQHAQVQIESLLSHIENYEFEMQQTDERAQVFENKIGDLNEAINSTDRLMENNAVRCENIERERQRYLKETSLYEQKREALEEDSSSSKKSLEALQDSLTEKKSGLDQEIELKNSLEQSIENSLVAIEDYQKKRDEIRKEYFSIDSKISTLKEFEEDSFSINHIKEAVLEKNDSISIHCFTEVISFQDRSGNENSRVKALFDKWAERLLVESLEDLENLVSASYELGFPQTQVHLLKEKAIDFNLLNQFAENHGLHSIRDFIKVNNNEISGLDSFLDRIYYNPNETFFGDDYPDLPLGMILFDESGFINTSVGEFTVGHSESKGILARKEEVQQLTAKAESFKFQLEENEKNIATLQEEKTTFQQSLKDTQNGLEGANKEVIELMGEIQKLTQSLSHINSLIDQNKIDQSRTDQSYNKLVDELKQLSSARLSLGVEKENLQEELDSIREESLDITDQRDEIKRQLEAKKLELATHEAKSSAVSDNKDNLISQYDQRQIAIQKKKDEIELIQSNIEKISEDKKESIEVISEHIYRREQLEQELQQKRELNSGILEDLKKVEEKLKELRQEHAEMQKSKTQKSMEIERLKIAAKGLIEQANESYQIDLLNTEFEFDETFNEKSSSNLVKNLKKKIDSLGAINMVAVEEYDKLNERFEFVTGQKDDVLSSIQILEDAVTEIETTAKAKFLDIFEKVNGYFIELFPILFPGGEASLNIVDKEDPLNTGVEIMVRMPGKKSQNMTLYSGGEKALTAISLIFALLKTKPTPFCFLDEVDAPLDEANVSKYNNVLDVLSQRFQFVVITHNRKTMEVLDQLYGVTMQEAGVSKIVGVDLNRDLPSHLQKSFQSSKEPTKERTVEGASSI